MTQVSLQVGTLGHSGVLSVPGCTWKYLDSLGYVAPECHIAPRFTVVLVYRKCTALYKTQTKIHMHHEKFWCMLLLALMHWGALKCGGCALMDSGPGFTQVHHRAHFYLGAVCKSTPVYSGTFLHESGSLRCAWWV